MPKKRSAFLTAKFSKIITGIKIMICIGNLFTGARFCFIIDIRTVKSKYRKIITEGIRAGKKRNNDKKSNLTRESSEREPPHPGQ